MIDFEQAKNDCVRLGFDAAAIIDVDQLELLPDVRMMCESNRCGAYGKNWACPPHCGSLEDCNAKLSEYKQGVVVQTITKLEDSFDIEGMDFASKKHNKIFGKVAQYLRENYERVLALGAGGCTVCVTCSCPDSPCRFPDKMHVPMEAYGLLVSDVCNKCNLKYYNGEATVTFISCYLIG